MTYRFGRKTMNLLLSALVLVWGIVPPGVQHTHEGGSDATHRHDDVHEVADHEAHHHDSNGEHLEQSTVADVLLLTEGAPHIHWQLLGLEFWAPTSEEPVNRGDEDVAPPTTVLARDGELLTTQADPPVSRVLLSGIYTPSSDIVRNLEQVPRPPNLVTSIPLCDMARRERTGVLLA